MPNAKILLFDIETSQMQSKHWDLKIYSGYLPHDRIVKESHVECWAAKWKDSDKVLYMDKRNDKDDKRIIKEMWKLLDEADIVITQNGKAFDEKKLNNRFAHYKIPCPSPYQHYDTKLIAKNSAKIWLPSYSLDYMAKFFKTKHQKLKHTKFPGNMLWDEIEKNNPLAWKEMETYNKNDVLVLEDVYNELDKYNRKGINLDLYNDSTENICSCGNKKFEENGHKYTETGKFTNYTCTKCGKHSSGKINLFSKEKRDSLKK